MVFVQITDPQFGMHTGDQEFAQETANFEFAIATVNRWKPDFVIITGDLVNKPGDPAQIAEYLRIKKQIAGSIPVYDLPGNHDIGNAPTPETLAFYRKTFGRDYYSFRQGEFAGVVINTTIIHTPGAVTAEVAKQRAWLDTELASLRAAGAKPIVLFQHHPWFTMKVAEPDGYFNLPLAVREDYMALLRKHGVKQAFAGHTHRGYRAEDAGIEMVVNGPVGMPLSPEGSGVRVCVVKGDRVEHAFHPLHRLPNKIR